MSTPIVPLRGATTNGLQPLVAEHLTWLQVMQYSPFTIANRRANLKQFLVWSHGQGLFEASQLSRSVIDGYHLAVARWIKPDGTTLGAGGQVQKLLALKMFLRWLHREELLSSDLGEALRFPRRQQRLPRAVLNQAEVERVLQVPDLSKPTGLRDRTILEVLYATGIRRSELARLHSTDVDRHRRTVLILQGKGGKDRVAPISERALWWIDRYESDGRPRLQRQQLRSHLFLTSRGNPMPPKRLTELVHGYVLKSGISKTGSCHLFRHTVATLMLEGGADIRYIQEMLGHAQLSTTAIYARVSITQLRHIYRRVHPAYRMPALT